MTNKEIHSTLGFLFSKDLKKVLLIRKQKPESHKGKLNGLGGKIERDESPLECIVREVEEESGLKTELENWKQVGTLEWTGWYVYILTSIYSDNIGEINSPEKSEVSWYPVSELPADVITNLPWLIPYCLDVHQTMQKIHLAIHYSSNESEDLTKNIRFILRSEFDQLYQFWIDSGLELYQKTDEQKRFENMLRLNPDLCFILENEKHEMIGTILGAFDGRTVSVHRFAIHPDYQREGLGTSLLNHLEKVVREKGVKKFVVQVLASNTDVIPFYEKHGFKEMTYLKSYYKEL